MADIIVMWKQSMSLNIQNRKLSGSHRAHAFIEHGVTLAITDPVSHVSGHKLILKIQRGLLYYCLVSQTGQYDSIWNNLFMDQASVENESPLLQENGVGKSFLAYSHDILNIVQLFWFNF